ncbi:MAG TPA: ABC transporter permease, partial [Gemmatimonadaceae bacterium]
MSLSRSSTFDAVRIAARTLRKQPGFTAVVVLSLALAIALNTTIYSVFDAMISPHVELRAPEDIFTIRLYGNYRGRVSTAEIDSALRSGLKNIDAVAWFSQVSSYFKRPIEAGPNYGEISVRPISLEYFPLIGPRVIAGRTFIEGDQYATPRPVVLAERTAATLFPDGKNPVGANVTISDTGYVVVGVLSRHSDFPNERAGAFVLGTPRQKTEFTRLIRLTPGSTGQDADRELTLVANRIALAAGDRPGDAAFRFFRPAKPQFRALRFHYAIGLSVLAVLLVACANLANMQLARGITRRRELALRTALGATRGRIVRHLLTESVLLSLAGLLLGLVLTYWGMVGLRAAVPPEVGAYSVEMQWSWRILVFALATTVACIFIVGVAPAIRVSRVDPNEMLKSGAGTGATKRNRRQYGYLVAAEIALSLGLLNGASLMVRSALETPDEKLPYDPMPLASGYIPLELPPKHELRYR